MWDNYYNALFKNESRQVENVNIRSKKHEVFTQKTIKTSLGNVDDKRFYVNNFVSYPLDDKYELLKSDLIEGVKKKYENDVDRREFLIQTVEETLDPKILIEIYQICFPLE